MVHNFICWYSFDHLELRLSDNPVNKHQTRKLLNKYGNTSCSVQTDENIYQSQLIKTVLVKNF